MFVNTASACLSLDILLTYSGPLVFGHTSERFTRIRLGFNCPFNAVIFCYFLLKIVVSCLVVVQPTLWVD